MYTTLRRHHSRKAETSSGQFHIYPSVDDAKNERTHLNSCSGLGPGWRSASELSTVGVAWIAAFFGVRAASAGLAWRAKLPLRRARASIILRDMEGCSAVPRVA